MNIAVLKWHLGLPGANELKQTHGVFGMKVGFLQKLIIAKQASAGVAFCSGITQVPFMQI